MVISTTNVESLRKIISIYFTAIFKGQSRPFLRPFPKTFPKAILRPNPGSKPTRVRAQLHSKSVSVFKTCLTLQMNPKFHGIFFCCISATRILHFLRLFSINFATRRQISEFKFTDLSPLTVEISSQQSQCFMDSIVVCKGLTDTQTQIQCTFQIVSIVVYTE